MSGRTAVYAFLTERRRVGRQIEGGRRPLSAALAFGWLLRDMTGGVNDVLACVLPAANNYAVTPM